MLSSSVSRRRARACAYRMVGSAGAAAPRSPGDGGPPSGSATGRSCNGMLGRCSGARTSSFPLDRPAEAAGPSRRSGWEADSGLWPPSWLQACGGREEAPSPLSEATEDASPCPSCETESAGVEQATTRMANASPRLSRAAARNVRLLVRSRETIAKCEKQCILLCTPHPYPALQDLTRFYKCRQENHLYNHPPKVRLGIFLASILDDEVGATLLQVE